MRNYKKKKGIAFSLPLSLQRKAISTEAKAALCAFTLTGVRDDVINAHEAHLCNAMRNLP